MPPASVSQAGVTPEACRDRSSGTLAKHMNRKLTTILKLTFLLLAAPALHAQEHVPLAEGTYYMIVVANDDKNPNTSFPSLSEVKIQKGENGNKIIVFSNVDGKGTESKADIVEVPGQMSFTTVTSRSGERPSIMTGVYSAFVSKDRIEGQYFLISEREIYHSARFVLQKK